MAVSKYSLVFLFCLLVQGMAWPQVGCHERKGSLSVMSYNIRLNTPNDGDNAWPNRREFLGSQIEFHHPDVVGVQEALPEQIDWLYENLTDYAFTGVGRQGGDAGEYSAIFYDRHKLELVRGGTFWLSTTPAEVSTGWDAALPRICTWGEFQPRGGGEAFLAFNTHFDHVGQEARKRSADLILAQMDSLNPAGLPAVLMGDFNLTPETEPIRAIAGRLSDAAPAAAVRLGPEKTFAGFLGKAGGDRRIDYIFVTPGIEVVRFATLSDWMGDRHASDHLAVMAHLNLRPTPLVIAHRGASGYAPENTLPAFRKAVELGAGMIELDVFTLADGEVVCFHDSKLKRLTGASGDLTDLDLAGVRQLSVGGIYRIPTLREVLDLTDKQLRINVELKGPGTAAPVYAILREYVRDHGWKMKDFHISSFRHDELREMRALDAGIDIGILPHGSPVQAIEVGKEVGAVSINAHHKSLNPESVAALREAGFRIYSWTVNDYADIRRLLDLGIDGFITNYPDRVQRLAAE